MKIELYFITGNKGKFLEAYNILRKYGIDLRQLNVKKMEIQSEDLKEIAIEAIKQVYNRIRRPVVVEDAGLFIKALNGFPGPYSSYVFKTIGINGILKLMENIEDRRAEFKSVVAFMHPSIGIKVFEGVVRGVISNTPRGNKGFGFDPIFIPDGSEKTFAEMSVEEKNMYSHRAKAFRALGEWIKENLKYLLKY